MNTNQAQDNWNAAFQLFHTIRTRQAVDRQTQVLEDAKAESGLERRNWDRANMGMAPVLSPEEYRRRWGLVVAFVRRLRQERLNVSRQGFLNRPTVRLTECGLDTTGQHIWLQVEPRKPGSVAWMEWYLIPDPGQEDDAVAFYRRQWAQGIRPTRVEAA